MKRLLLLVLAAAAVPAAGFAGCSSQPSTPDLGPSTFHVKIESVNGNPLPTEGQPLPANHGDMPEKWAFTIEARTPGGDLATDFNGYVRLSLAPGTVAAVTGAGASGRDILVKNGTVTGVVEGTAVYGPSRLWVEDLGYLPAAAGATPRCSNGLDDDGDGLIDFPADPGCFFADDDSEQGGTYAAGVSAPVQYALPLIADVRGGARTPYPNEAIEIATGDPEFVVVTRVSSNGFFVTDVGTSAVANGYNSLYAFNFSTPPNLRVCDRITYLGGTANDFFGFTQLSFPSFRNTYPVLGLDGGMVDVDAGVPGCRVPEPTVLAPSFFTGDKNTTSQNLYKSEAGLVRLEGFTIAKYFGAGTADADHCGKNVFCPGVSNCDFNGDGVIDFTQINCTGSVKCEGDCSNACDADVNCTEYTAFAARGEYKMSHGGVAATMIKVNTSTVGTFDPVGNAGATIPYLSGTLTEFSGGTLNWTIEVRCPDDLVCPAALGCTTQQPISSAAACVRPRTLTDNDEGTN